MPHNSSNYFAYKRNKYRRDIEQPPKTISKANFLFQLFIATFIIMFIVIVFAIMKYSSKMDIEYSKRANSLNNNFISDENENNYQNDSGDVQLKIDKRLLLIQQEENAPNEAKIIKDAKNNEVIDPIYVEQNKKIEKEHQNEAKKQAQLEENKDKQNIKISNDSIKPIIPDNQNITIMSKVLVGKFSTFEDAQRLQDVIKSKDSSLAPYVKKVGDVFTVQIGSYKDFNVAKFQAQTLKSKGLDVWIYQQ